MNPSSTSNSAGPRDYARAVIVAAILIILAGMVIPFLRSREMARDEERARLDLIDVRDAIRAFMRDVGLPPTRDKDGNDRALLRLCGPGRPPQGAYFVNDAYEGEYVDHLFRNEPLGKANSPGYAHWSGPYLKRLEYDPWYRAYTVVAYPLNARDGGGDGRVCIVVCAGPNGRLDGDYSSPRDPVAAGDDLLEVVTPDGPESVGK